MNEFGKGLDHLKLSMLADSNNADTFVRYATYYSLVGDR